MANRTLQAWETNAPAPFATIQAGGPLNGIVTISAIPEGRGRVLLEATWTRDGEPRSVAATIDGYDAARSLAHDAATQLAAGHEAQLGSPS